MQTNWDKDGSWCTATPSRCWKSLPRPRHLRRGPRRPEASSNQVVPLPPRPPRRRRGLGGPARDRRPRPRAAGQGPATGSGRVGLASWRRQTREPAQGCSVWFSSARLCSLNYVRPRSTVFDSARSAPLGPARLLARFLSAPSHLLVRLRSAPFSCVRSVLLGPPLGPG